MAIECPRCKTVNDDSATRCDCGLVFATGQMQASRVATPDVASPPRAVDVIGRLLWALAGAHIIWLSHTKEWALPVISGVVLSVGFAMAWEGTFRRFR